MDRQSMTGMDDDAERQTPHGHGETEILLENKSKLRLAKFCLIMILIMVAITACFMVPFIYYDVDEHYSVAIDAASVLEPNMGVSFNLILGIASRSHGAKACIDPGMYVEVFYRGVQVAATDAAETRRTCARPRNVAVLPIVATASRGAVPDNLAPEMGQGAAVFDLRLHTPSRSYTYGGDSCIESWVSDGKGSRIGDASVPCDSLKYTHICRM